MMHLYSVLCTAVHPKRFTIMWGGSPQPPPVCSIHLDDVTAATGQRRQCAHHTPATGGEERESILTILSKRLVLIISDFIHIILSLFPKYYKRSITRKKLKK